MSAVKKILRRLKNFILAFALLIFMAGCITFTERQVSLISIGKISQTDRAELLSIVDQVAKTNQLSLEQSFYPNILRSYKQISHSRFIGSTLLLGVAIRIEPDTNKLTVVIGNEERERDAKQIQAAIFKALAEHFGSDRVVEKTINISDSGWLD